jgi:hypothetical protein
MNQDIDDDPVWAELLKTVSAYDLLWELSPELISGIRSTIYSPNRAWIFLSSIRRNVRTKCLEELRLAANAIVQNYKSESNKSDEIQRAYARIDLHEVCLLICKLDPSNESFYDVDWLLQNNA